MLDLLAYATLGFADLPAVTAVLDTDTVGGVAGTYHAPTVAEVQEGVTFGPSSGYTGTYGTESTGDGGITNAINVSILTPSGWQKGI